MTSYVRRQLYSILIAAFFWAVIIVAFILIPVRTAVEEPVYREIHIQLSPVEQVEPPQIPETEKVPEPVVEEVVEAAVPEPVVVPVPEPVKPVLSESAPKAPEPAPKSAEPAPSPAPAAKTPAPAPEPAKQTLVKSVDQAMAEQAASKGSKKSVDEVDWDALFGESSTATSTTSSGEKTFVAQQGPSTSGQAAAITADTGTNVTASSGKTTDASVSDSTASALGSINAAASGTVPVKKTDTSTAGSSSVEAEGASDLSDIEWGNGAGRRMTKPSKPGITFTDEQKAFITSSVRDIRISFKVRADGTVLRDSIVIDKKASLPAQISQEIERQISEWQFETGTADGQAVFIYSIIKE